MLEAGLERHADAMTNRPLKPAAQVLARQLPGGAVLVHLGTNQIFELNETSARVWELLGEGLAPDDILNRLLDDFDVAPEQASTELTDLLARLQDAGLLSAT
ncbi:MAG: PqqD family protein [Vicinamibacterales bacterium]